MPPAETADIDTAANDFLTNSPDKSPGLWLAVWDPAKGYYEQAYGDAVADTTTATVADHSWIGSITKTVFATAVLQQIAPGRSRSPTPCRPWTPSSPRNTPRSAP